MVSVKIKVEYLASLMDTTPSDHIDQRMEIKEINPLLSEQLIARLIQTKSALAALKVLEVVISQQLTVEKPVCDVTTNAMNLIRHHRGKPGIEKIGRASCRERV